MKFLFVFILTTVILVGCSVEPTDGTSPTNIESSTTTVTTEQTVYDPLLDFNELIPDAVIYDTLQGDLNQDGKGDYIILYSSETWSVNAGLAVCLRDSLYSGIDLSPDRGLKFCGRSSLSYNNEIPVVSFYLEDADDGTILFFKVEYSYDNVDKGANYKIYSEEIEQEDQYEKS